MKTGAGYLGHFQRGDLNEDDNTGLKDNYFAAKMLSDSNLTILDCLIFHFSVLGRSNFRDHWFIHLEQPTL